MSMGVNRTTSASGSSGVQPTTGKFGAFKAALGNAMDKAGDFFKGVGRGAVSIAKDLVPTRNPSVNNQKVVNAHETFKEKPTVGNALQSLQLG